ncbi:hypothetical protein F5Y19DRAFT_425045 [Xylariaceae sp. FL1651]|nr:hypothetical protein F5Y19DRAFT_425045 [Xylariaceae sp. FL1651]
MLLSVAAIGIQRWLLCVIVARNNWGYPGVSSWGRPVLGFFPLPIPFTSLHISQLPRFDSFYFVTPYELIIIIQIGRHMYKC